VQRLPVGLITVAFYISSLGLVCLLVVCCIMWAYKDLHVAHHIDFTVCDTGPLKETMWSIHGN